jgi:hypothetical protein
MLEKLHTGRLFASEGAPQKSDAARAPRSIFGLCFVLLFALRSGGTSVAVIYSSSQIVVAADTLFVKDVGAGRKVRSSVCKLKNAGNIFFVSIGFVDNPDSNFYLNDLGRKATLKGKGVAASAQELMKIGEAPIRDTIYWLKKNNPTFYASDIKGGHDQLGVSFFGFDDGQPVIAVVHFSVKEQVGGKISVTSALDVCPNIKCWVVPNFTVLGQHTATDAYRKTAGFSNAYTISHPVESAQKFIELEADGDPLNVGRPIDIVTITPKGHTCSVKGKCDCK